MPHSRLFLLMACAVTFFAAGHLSAQATIQVPGDAPTIQAAILMAIPGDVVQVAAGTFNESTIDFGGKAITVRGDSGGTTIVGTVRFVNGEGQGSVLQEMNLQGGGAEVIICTNASPTISHCDIAGQMMNVGKSCVTVRADGATATGAAGMAAAPLFVGCLFLNNTTSGVDTAAVSLWSVSQGSAAQCAAIFSACVFSGNSGGAAGAIRATAMAPQFATALNTPFLLDCTFNFNASLGGLAGALALSADGAFAATSSTITNCFLHGNHGLSAGALGLDSIGGIGSVTAKVIHCSFNDNAPLSSGGAAVTAQTGSTLVVWNSILRGSGVEITAASIPAQVTVSASNIQGGFAGPGNIDADPIWVDATNGDLHIHAGSPCIDGGAATAPFLPLTDIDNQTRAPASADMGADEAFLVGTFEDFTQTSLINGAGEPDQQEKVISEGDLLTLQSQTPSGAFYGGVPIIAAQFWGPTYTNGIRPVSPGGYPELHINPFGGFILKAGGSLGPVPYGFSAPIPFGANLAGVNCRIQSIVVNPTAANQQFAASHTLELSIQ